MSVSALEPVITRTNGFYVNWVFKGVFLKSWRAELHLLWDLNKYFLKHWIELSEQLLLGGWCVMFAVGHGRLRGDVVSCLRGDLSLTMSRCWPWPRWGMWPQRRSSCAWDSLSHDAEHLILDNEHLIMRLTWYNEWMMTDALLNF